MDDPIYQQLVDEFFLIKHARDAPKETHVRWRKAYIESKIQSDTLSIRSAYVLSKVRCQDCKYYMFGFASIKKIMVRSNYESNIRRRT